MQPNIDKLSRRSDIAYNWMVVFLSASFLIYVGEISRIVVMGSTLYAMSWFDTPEFADYWTRWATGLAAISFFQIQSGWMLGRFVTRLNPWMIGLIISVCHPLGWWPIAASPFDEAHMVYLQTTGNSNGYIIWIGLNIITECVNLGIGIWLGRRASHQNNTEEHARNGVLKQLTSTHSLFVVGENEVHEVGMLMLMAKGAVFTVDGEIVSPKLQSKETLIIRVLNLGRDYSLVVGENEKHDLIIDGRYAPFRPIKLMVDGKLAIEHCFPEYQAFMNRLRDCAYAFLIAFAASLVLIFVVVFFPMSTP